MVAQAGFAQSLPVITSSPANQTVNPGSTATFNVGATGAMGYQWMFNGTNIVGATSTTLQVTNAQGTNCGYYSVIVQNAAGCVPSAMAYLFIDYTSDGINPFNSGILPLANNNDTYFAGDIENSYYGGGNYPTNGTVQMVVGPQLDETSPVGLLVRYRTTQTGASWFNSGYYKAADQQIATIAPGQSVYYSVVCRETNSGYAYIHPSSVMLLNAGTNGSAAPSIYGLKFPGWFPVEGVEPIYYSSSPTNQLRVAGETFSFSVTLGGYPDYGAPTYQWRKNGVLIGSQQSFTVQNPPTFANANPVLTISNAQPSDVGVYDLDIRGSAWFIGPKIYVSIQTTNGQGVFQAPKISGTNFICNLTGAAGRNYKVQTSTNLTSWADLTTLSNANGTVTFTNAPDPGGPRFYRTVLLP
ncbi:MAG: hypothetical protein JF609_11080 [Verrucomicrobia bacterium]|nr:hypothetical protein [Verrucomicrobiota bacterium]